MPELAPIVQVLDETRAALQAPPGGGRASVHIGGKQYPALDQGLTDAVAERSKLTEPPNEEIGSAILMSLDVMRDVPAKTPDGLPMVPTEELIPMIKIRDWRQHQEKHLQYAIAGLALGYDRAHRKGLVSDIGGRYGEFITRIGGEYLVTLALTGVFRHDKFHGDLGVHYEPFQVARLRQQFPLYQIGDTRFRQALQRLCAHQYLVPNLLGYLRDHPRKSASDVRSDEIVSYQPPQS